MTKVTDLIPAAHRRSILESNAIALAQGTEACAHTRLLVTVWKEYVEPTLTLSCGLCYQRVIKNYRALQDEFITAELNSRLLDED